jgi:hypothetical protein
MADSTSSNPGGFYPIFLGADSTSSDPDVFYPNFLGADSTSSDPDVVYLSHPDPALLRRRVRVIDIRAAPSLPYRMLGGYRSLGAMGNFNYMGQLMGSGNERFNGPGLTGLLTRVTRYSDILNLQ